MASGVKCNSSIKALIKRPSDGSAVWSSLLLRFARVQTEVGEEGCRGKYGGGGGGGGEEGGGGERSRDVAERCH